MEQQQYIFILKKTHRTRSTCKLKNNVRNWIRVIITEKIIVLERSEMIFSIKNNVERDLNPE